MNEDRRNLMVRNIRRIFTFIAILTLVVGQIFVYTTPVQKDTIFPSALWISVTGILLFILSHLYRPSRSIQNFFARFQLSQKTFWIIFASILSLMTVLTMILFEQQERTNFIPVLTFWLFAALCYIAAFSKEFPSAAQVWEWLKRHRHELSGIGAVTLLGLVLRFYKLGEIPRVVNGDEARVGIAALGYLSQNPFSLWENFGGLYTQVISLALKVFGVSPFSLRFAAAVGGTLAIPALYLLARQISGRRIALIAACMLAISHTHIHFSRTVAVAYIQGTWLIPLELYFLLSGLIKRSSWRTAVSGILLAMHFTVYLDSQIITALVLAYMLIVFLLLRPWFKPALNQAFVFWGGFGLILLPELVYIRQHPDIFFDRLNQDGMFQTGRLAQIMANTGQNAAQVLGGRVVHAFLSLIYYPSIDFYGSLTPMLSLMSAMLFLLGLALALWKMRSPSLLLLNGYFWAGTLSIGMFALPATADTYRMLIVLPAAFLLAAIGLDRALRALGAGWAQNRKTYTVATGLTLSSLLVFNMWAYYFNFAERCLYSDDDRGQTRFASSLGNYARTIGRENTAYLLSDDTYFYGSHDSVDFLSNRHPIINAPEPVDTLQARPNETIIASPNRIAELRTWADNHPGGELHYRYDCQDTVLLAYQFQ
jgi:hypothetical protein